MGDGTGSRRPRAHSAVATDPHQRCDDVIQAIEDAVIDRTDVPESGSNVETSARLPRRPERRGVPEPTCFAPRAAAFGDIEHDTGRRASHLIFKRAIVTTELLEERTNVGENGEHDVVDTQHVKHPFALFE